MGAINIVESSISENSEVFWEKVGTKLPDIELDTSKYNRGFVQFAMVVGVFASIKLTVCGVKKLYKCLHKNKPLEKKQFLQKYGEGSYAIIADVARNQQYCMYLARMGINLIMMGDEQDINIARDMVKLEHQNVKIESIVVDWSKGDFNYEQFVEQVKKHEISFLVLPKIMPEMDTMSYGTHIEEIPPYEHFFLLVRYLGPVMQWRSYQSAIILPSSNEVDKIKTGHGVSQGIISALDGFMRCLNFEPETTIEVIAARGSVNDCFRDLGKEAVSK